MLLWILLISYCVATAVPCGYPGSPSHSTVTFNTENIQTGTVATYRCELGFDLLGPLRRLCVENGTWIPLGVPVCVMNVAAGKAAMQSSSVAQRLPHLALDGSTSTCAQTEMEDSPWWYVNLLEPFVVQLVTVDFGISCCANNLPATVTVRVGINRPDLSANPVCNRFTGNIEAGRPLFFPCTSTVAGAFMSVHVETSSPLTLSICETLVYTDQVVSKRQCPRFNEDSTSVATYNGKCYFFHSDHPRTLESAVKFCNSQGGSLLHETNAALQGFLSWELYKRHKNRGSYWNGLTRRANTKKWIWLDGKDVPMSFWSVVPANQSCSKFDGSLGWLWKGEDCDSELNFICEYKPATCGQPERPANSSLLIRSDAVGSAVEYRCNTGHLHVGPSIRTCLATGFFSEWTPKCSYIECGFPANIPHGDYRLVNGSRYYHSTVHYFCLESYMLVGRANLMCDADRKWDGPPPRCDPLLCHNPPSIAHGNVTVTVNTTVPGTIAEYSCDPAYKLIGDMVISCDSTGFWTAKPPSCELDKEKLYNAKMEGQQKRSRSSMAARLNMGGIIALGIFGGFVFLAVIISIVVIIVRRNSSHQDSLESISTYESQGSREKLYQRQCWIGHNGSSMVVQPLDNMRCIAEPIREQRHQRHAPRDSSEISLESSASPSRWCPKYEKN